MSKSSPALRRPLALVVLAAALCLACLGPSTALASFTRPFVGQIKGTPTGSGGAHNPFEPRFAPNEVFGEEAAAAAHEGVAVDSHNDLWVSEPNGALREFNESGDYLQSVEPAADQTYTENIGKEVEGYTRRENLAIEDATGNFYVTGEFTHSVPTGAVGYTASYDGRVEVFGEAGGFLDGWYHFGDPKRVAVDNSSDVLDPSRCALSACTVYVSQGGEGSGGPAGVEKFSVNAAGEPTPAPFTAAESYIAGSAKNDIVGTPEGSFQLTSKVSPVAVALDSEGNIYVAGERRINGSDEEAVAVYEYNPAGVFLREFTGNTAPGLGSSGNGFGEHNEQIEAIAVDPISHHLLVALSSETGGAAAGAIDEFEVPSGAYVNRITEIEPSAGVRKHLGRIGQMTVDSSGKVYLVESPEVAFDASTGQYGLAAGAEAAIDVFGPGKALPSVTLAEATTRTPASAVVSGTFEPEGQPPSECVFEYVSEAAYEATGFGDLSSGGEAPCEPAVGTIPADFAAHTVTATLSRLQAGTTYQYRLSASTGGVGGSSHSEPLPFTTPAAPRVQAGSTVAQNISSAFADLHARVEPLGANTSYWFEYGPTTAYGSAAPLLTAQAPDGVQIGSGGLSGSAVASVVQRIGGLSAGTTYHFRVVARSEVEGEARTTYGEDATFATLAPSVEGLPDGRAYELVTPPNKGSAEDMFGAPEDNYHRFVNNDVGYPSDSGEEFLMTATKAAFGEPAHPFAASSGNAYAFRRDAAQGRWQTIPLASPSLGVQSVGPEVFDPTEFSQIGLGDNVGSGASVEGQRSLMLLGPPAGLFGASCESLTPGDCYTELANEAKTEAKTEQQIEQATGELLPSLAGASRDLSHIVLESADRSVVPGADEGQDAVSSSLWQWSGGEFTLASVNPEGSPFVCGAILGHGVSAGGGGAHDAVSADGARIFLTAPDPYLLYDPESASTIAATKGCWHASSGPTSDAPQLYMRAGAHTIELSAPEAGFSAAGGQHAAVFAGASEEGSKVFFVTETELTRDDAGNHDPELYECEITEVAGEPACGLTRISGGSSHEAVGEVWTVPAISADGSAVYFTAFGSLAAGAPNLLSEPGAGKAQYGGPVNLYRYDTVTATTTFVATVDSRDYRANDVGQWWTPAVVAGGISATNIHQEISSVTNADWYTTPDGDYLLFASTSDLTGYSTAEAGGQPERDCPSEEGTTPAFGHCSEVYRFDALAGEKGEPSIVCVSCDRSGEAPVSNATFALNAGSLMLSGPPVRAMSDSGACAFFDSADPLVKQAQNGTQDVYEWEAPGGGRCETSPPAGTSVCEQAQGCIYLIGSGDSPYPSFFLGASANGANVFFGTSAKLVPRDTDQSGDLYDARIGGGFPTPAGIGPCEGDACSSPPSAPLDATPGSLTFAGPGDVPGESSSPSGTHKTVTKKTTPKCKKPKKLSHGKCVKPKPKKKAKKSSHRKGSK